MMWRFMDRVYYWEVEKSTFLFIYLSGNKMLLFTFSKEYLEIVLFLFKFILLQYDRLFKNPSIKVSLDFSPFYDFISRQSPINPLEYFFKRLWVFLETASQRQS